MSSAGQATQKQPRGPKTRGTDWWTPPPDTPLNLAIPYVVSSVGDGLSLTQQRVLAYITEKHWTKSQDGSKKGERRGFICKPPGYTKMAQGTGLARKTVYNAVKALIAKGVLEVFHRHYKGKQRTHTVYFALHFGDILPAWRANPEWFHTAYKDSVVARKRSKQFMTVEEGEVDWQIDRNRAPKKGCGRGLAEIVEAAIVPANVAPIAPPQPMDNDEDVNAVLMELMRWSGACCLKDANDIIADARAEAKRTGYAELGYGGPFPCLTVVEVIRDAAADYKPSPSQARNYPKPTPGWFLGGAIRRHVRHRVMADWEQKEG
jgi:hypothetical protein